MNIFKKLTDLKYKRTFKEAIGFYLTYLVLIVFSCGTATLIIRTIINSDSATDAAKIGAALTVASTITLSFLILKKKKLIGLFFFVILALSSGLLVLVGGSLLGVLIPSYLSTLKSENK